VNIFFKILFYKSPRSCLSVTWYKQIAKKFCYLATMPACHRQINLLTDKWIDVWMCH